jgi:hypothetical protein
MRHGLKLRCYSKPITIIVRAADTNGLSGFDERIRNKPLALWAVMSLARVNCENLPQPVNEFIMRRSNARFQPGTFSGAALAAQHLSFIDQIFPIAEHLARWANWNRYLLDEIYVGLETVGQL